MKLWTQADAEQYSSLTAQLNPMEYDFKQKLDHANGTMTPELTQLLGTIDQLIQQKHALYKQYVEIPSTAHNGEWFDILGASKKQGRLKSLYGDTEVIGAPVRPGVPYPNKVLLERTVGSTPETLIFYFISIDTALNFEKSFKHWTEGGTFELDDVEVSLTPMYWKPVYMMIS